MAILRNRRYGAGALLAMLGLVALAAGTAWAEEFGPDQRRHLGELKTQAFERLGARRAEALARQYPERTRLSVYIAVAVERYALEQVTVYIDDRPPVTYDYRESEAAALLDGTQHRVLRTNIEPGSHRVRVDFSGRLKNIQDADDPPLTGRIELAFDKRETPKALILPVAPEALRPTRELSPRSWQWRDEVTDPRLDMVRFQRHIGAGFPAMVELMAMAATADPAELSADYHGLLAHAYLDFAMEEQARAALEDALRAGLTPKTERDVRLRLAELVFKRGRDEEAAADLRALRDGLTPEQLVVWQGLMAHILMGQGRHADAVDALSQGDTALEVLTEPGSEDKQTLYMRYNYAMALLQAGETVRGRTLLDRLGRMRPFTRAQKALRERANLVLAYDFLSAGEGATAKEIFQRMHLDGLYTEHALLGLGWSELAPRGDRQERVAVGDEPEAGTYGIANPDSGRFNRDDMPERFNADAFRQVELVPFKQARQAKNEDARRRRALVAWNELVGRVPSGEAVQEARVASAYALEELGAEDQAMARYRDDVADLERLRERLQRRVDALRNGQTAAPGGTGSPPLSVRSLTGRWQSHYLPDLDEVRWLEEFMVSERVHALAEHYMDLYALALGLRGRLPVLDEAGSDVRPADAAYKGVDLPQAEAVFDGPAPGAISPLLASMGAAGEGLQGRLRMLAADTLTDRLALLDEFLASARLGLARLYEKRLAQAGSLAPGDTLTAVPVRND